MSVVGAGIEGADGELDGCVETEIRPARPDIVESVAQGVPHDVRRLVQPRIALETVFIDQRLIGGAEQSGSLRIAARAHESGGRAERPREGQHVSNRVAELQAFPEHAGRDVEVVAANRELCKAREAGAHPVDVRQRTLALQGLLHELVGPLVPPLPDEVKVTAEIPLDMAAPRRSPLDSASSSASR